MNVKSAHLHPAQRDVYLDQLINIDSPHYNIGGYIKLKGFLDKEKFLEAVNSAPKVFDAFKMRFDLDAADYKCYAPETFDKYETPELDFSVTGNPVQEASSWIQNRFNTPFVIQKESPLFEQALLKIADDENWFFGRYHHLITDGYGFIVYVQYLARKYKSLLSSEGIELIYPSYLEEAAKASEYFNSSVYESDRKYWEEKISEKPAKILHRKYFHKNNTEKTSTNYVFSISKERKKLLDEIQLATKSGLQQLTIAALIIYFGKTSKQSEFVFGIPVHKRSSRQLRNIVGMFSGILPYKAFFYQDKKLIELIEEIIISQKKDYRHQNYPIGDLSRNLKAISLEDYLYQVSIDYEPLNFKLDFGDKLNAEVSRVSNEREKNPLQLCWLDYGDDQPLKLRMHYGNAYFDQKEIELLTERILFIIEQFPSSLNKNIGDIKILPAKEKALIEKFNDTSREYPKDKTIINLFEEQAEKNPDDIALVFEKNVLTYRQLNNLSNQFGHYLKTKGVTGNSLVPICVKRSTEMIAGILGILKAGAAYVPIDPEYPEERIRFMLDDINASMIVTGKDCLKKLSGITTADCVLADASVISDQSTENVNAQIKPNDLAYIIYTSGSTGKPKGVMTEHRSVVNLINSQSLYFNTGSDERILQFSNYCFDASVEQIFLALLNGASLIMFPEGLQLRTGLFEEFLKEKKITHLHATPVFLESLHPENYESLRRVIAGGDICKKELSEQWKGKVKFYNEYGPTETTVTSVEYWDYNGNSPEVNSLPIGKPIANTRLYITDENKSILPIGVEGELYISGAGVSRGYLNRNVQTEEKFSSDIFGNEPDLRMYHTGDLARWLPDGNVEFLGRIDEQVKIRGYRIEPGEIESALLESEEVNQAAVLAIENKSGEKRLVGFVVPNEKFDSEAIQIYLRKKLPEYMVPAKWIELESIPLTSNGKVDRNALMYEDAINITSNEYEAPRNEMEFKIAEIWKEILNPERVGVNDNFFELGGHSMNAVQLTMRLHKLLNIKTDIGTIFSNPTVRQLSEALLSEKQNQFTEIKKLPEQEYYPLSHAQKRFWILSHFKDGSEAYNVSNAFVIEGELNMEAFKKALYTIIERHEILRTVFLEIGGEPRQKILSLEELNFKIDEVDLQNEVNAEEVIKNRIEKDSLHAYDLTRGPLLRSTIFREAADKFVLVFNIHHIISDGWSKGIFINEFLNLYNSYSCNEESSLSPLSIQYRDYAAWHSDSFGRQKKFWKDMYKNGITVLNFPADYKRPKVLSYFGDIVHRTVSESATLKLREMSAGHNMSLNNLLLTLYGFIVAMHSSQEEVVIGTVSSGRSHPDLENLIGVFINFLPVKLSPKRYLKLSEYLSDSLNTLIQAYGNQDYPFDLMVEDNIKKRDVSRNPFFDTMINFQLENNLQDRMIIKPQQSMHEGLFQSVLDFKLDVIPSNGMLNLYLSYNSKLFSKERMTGFIDNFIELLNTVLREPDGYLSQYYKPEDEKLNKEVILQPALETKQLPVNICASFVIEPVREYMEYWSKEFDLNINISIAPYNQVFQQLINPQSILYGNRGINILFIRIEDWLRDQKEMSVSEQINFLNRTYSEFISLIENIRKKVFIPFLIGAVPVYVSDFSNEVSEHFEKLNKELEMFLSELPFLQLFDLNKIADLYDVDEIYDSGSDEAGHLPFTQEFYAALGTFLTRKVNSFINHGYKVIALDCDNTLWKGICGEAGALNVIIDENYTQLQEFFIEKYNEGFLLVICSKNNEEDVWEVFDRHPGMKIKREHIAAYRINWEPKPDNLLSISKELNLGMNSFIFVDDNEFETEQMSQSCPDVFSLALPEDEDNFSSYLNHIWAFDYFNVTDEDRKRNEMYKVEKERKEEEIKFGSLDDFLKSLEIKVDIRPAGQKDIERSVQLSMRTNQFNLNGIRKTPEDIAKSITDENSLNRIIEVKDRFGDYGIVGLVIGRHSHNSLVLETFLLSCRVLGRNVEDFILSELQNYCAANGLDFISVQFQPTAKNKPFREFLTRADWVQDSKTNVHCLFLKTAEQIIA
jgi:amino acid adenylation domain-containing protein/FkbH-like protein